MNPQDRILAIAMSGAVLAGCGTMPLPIDAEFNPIPVDPVRFENVVLGEDRQSVRVNFTGGPELRPDDPCSVAYRGTAEVVDDELHIGIYAQQHPKPLAAGMGCDAMGHPRTLWLELEAPFTGAVVRDLAGQVFMLEPPAGLAQIGALPDGWELRREGNVLDSPTPRWERVWSPDPDPWPAEGDSMLILIQALGGAGQHHRGRRRAHRRGQRRRGDLLRPSTDGRDGPRLVTRGRRAGSGR